jgi:hypothetical protein
MKSPNSKIDAAYYAEIQILVDGWPWNLSEFDFRRWFAPGSCPRALVPVEIAGEIRAQYQAPPVSGNRRVDKRRKKRDRRRNAA